MEKIRNWATLKANCQLYGKKTDCFYICWNGTNIVKDKYELAVFVFYEKEKQPSEPTSNGRAFLKL